MLNPQPTAFISSSQPVNAGDAPSAVHLPGPSVVPSQPEANALGEQELDFAAMWEDIDFDWDGDRRVFLS